MLAVKLHKKRKPWLGRGSFLIPIASWKSGKIHIRNWVKMLNKHNSKRSNNCIRYITLVKIPDNHPVEIYEDWFFHGVWFLNNKHRTCPPLKDENTKVKQALMEWVPCGFGHHTGRPRETGCAPAYDLPELVLDKKLPSSCIKWTKDIRLLYGYTKRMNGVPKR